MKTLLRLTGLLGPYWRWMTAGAAVALVVVLSNVALLGVAGWFIAAMAAAGAAGGTMNYFTPAAAIRLFAILRTGGRYLERLITHEATLRFLSGLRVWFYRHVEPLAPAALQHYRGGDLLSRMGADIDALENFYLRTLAPVAVAVVAALAVFAFLSHYSWAVALADLGFLLLAGIAVPVMAHRLGRGPGKRMLETSSRLRVNVVDAVQGMGELVVFGAMERQQRRIAGLSRTLVDDQDRMSRVTGLGSALSGLFTNLAVWLVTLTAIALVRQQQVPAVDLPMFALVALGSFEAVAGLPQAYQYLGHTLAAARRIFAVVDTPPAIHEPPGPSPQPSDCGLRLAGVRLRYGPAEPWALDGIDLDVAQGQRLAIVGSSGCGKTSLANALLRFWEYQDGAIELGGRDLSAYRTDDVRRLITLAPQRAHLFNATVRENLLLAKPAANHAELVAACTAAQIHDEIAALPQGYDTYVGEAGARVSGGQARRLAVARALLADTPILILDEPTEGLDATTAGRLMDALLDRPGGRTLIVITHRATGLERMDRIAVMENGRIVERGTHAALLGEGTRYRELYRPLTWPTAVSE
ncbi:MAG: thiol reductant ABC exporter subunit CydC [Gammaproteobacteria bacterium]